MQKQYYSCTELNLNKYYIEYGSYEYIVYGQFRNMAECRRVKWRKVFTLPKGGEMCDDEVK